MSKTIKLKKRTLEGRVDWLNMQVALLAIEVGRLDKLVRKRNGKNK